MELTSRYQQALAETFALFGDMPRKNPAKTPFMAHLLSVSCLVIEHGGNEDEAIAALLHDAIEDAGGQQRYDAIVQQFGVRVADIVRGVSDTETTPKPPWEQRKQDYINHLIEDADDSMLLVSAADKVHNIRSMIDDYHLYGEGLWQVFSRGRNQQLWVYEQYTEAIESRIPDHSIAKLLRQELESLKALTK